MGWHALGPAPQVVIRDDDNEKADFKMFILATLKSFENRKINCKTASCFPLKVDGFCLIKDSKVDNASTFSCHFGFVNIVLLSVSKSG